MFLILWIIRMNQPFTKYSDITIWRDDWFIAMIFCVMMLACDVMVVVVGLVLLDIINIISIYAYYTNIIYG